MYLLESPRRGDSNKYPKRFSKEYHGTVNEKIHDPLIFVRFADFWADRIDVITNLLL